MGLWLVCLTSRCFEPLAVSTGPCHALLCHFYHRQYLYVCPASHCAPPVVVEVAQRYLDSAFPVLHSQADLFPSAHPQVQLEKLENSRHHSGQETRAPHWAVVWFRSTQHFFFEESSLKLTFYIKYLLKSQEVLLNFSSSFSA